MSRISVNTLFIVLALSLTACSARPDQSQEMGEVIRGLIQKGELDSARALVDVFVKTWPKEAGVADEMRKSIEQKKMEKTAVKEIPLDYSFSQNGIRLTVAGASRSRETAGNLRTSLADGEVWIILNVTMKDESNKFHDSKWRDYFRVLTKTGEPLSPSIPILTSSQNGTPDFIQANERKEMKLHFQVKEAEGPFQLKFSDGKIQDLNF